MSHSHILENVVKLIGVHPTIRLMRLKCGLEFNLPLPQNLDYMHWLVVEVGFDNAVKLCEEYRGEKIKLPNEVNSLLQIRNQLIVEEYKSGESVRGLAKKHSLDRKLIETILKKYNCRGEITPEDKQGDLWQD